MSFSAPAPPGSRPRPRLLPCPAPPAPRRPPGAAPRRPLVATGAKSFSPWRTAWSKVISRLGRFFPDLDPGRAQLRGRRQGGPGELQGGASGIPQAQTL
jgi:hypothetical protein